MRPEKYVDWYEPEPLQVGEREDPSKGIEDKSRSEYPKDCEVQIAATLDVKYALH